MKRRDFLKCAAGIGIGILGSDICKAAGKVKAKRPNIVFLLTDDQGYCDLSMHGNPIVKTPVIDNFAKESIEFTQFYASPVCMPTRASLMTGKYNYRVGVAIDGSKTMFTEEVTLAEALKEADYATALYGKWHLGDRYPHRPIDQGFDEAIRHTAGSMGVYPSDNSNFDPVLLENGKYKKFKGYSMDIYTDAALSFIDSNKEKPFFLYLATNVPHRPLEVSDEYAQPYRKQGFTKKTDEVYGMVANIDHNFGRILKKLKDLGLDENTIVVFMTDNGPTDFDDDRWRMGLRGRKCWVWEGGIRVPFIIRWPEKFKGPGKIDTIAAHIDFMPTLLQACNVKPSQDIKFDGISLMPLLQGEKPGKAFDRALYFQLHAGPLELYRHFAARNQRYKLVQATNYKKANVPYEDLKFELFDIPADPFEKNDISAKHPEIVARLKKGYEEWFEDVTSFGPKHVPVRIRIDPVHQNPVVVTRRDWLGVNGIKDTDVGYWKINIVQPGKYNVTVNLRKAQTKKNYTTHIQIANITGESKIKRGKKSCVIENLILPKGKTKLQAWLLSEGEKYGAHSIELEYIK